MQLIKAKKLWENGEFLGGVATEFSFPCERITNSTPREAWLRKRSCCGMPPTYQLTLEDPKESDAIKGVWIEFDGNGVLIDAEALQDVVDKCNGCCGSAPTIEGHYENSFPDTSSVSQAAEYEVTRLNDDGSFLAVQKFRLDYLNEYVEGTLSVVSHNAETNTTVYKFKAYRDPRLKGTDTITAEVDRVFVSNEYALAEGETQFELTVNADGVEHAPVAAATLAALVVAIAAVPALVALGAWAVEDTAIKLTTEKVTNAVLILEGIA